VDAAISEIRSVLFSRTDRIGSELRAYTTGGSTQCSESVVSARETALYRSVRALSLSLRTRLAVEDFNSQSRAEREREHERDKYIQTLKREREKEYWVQKVQATSYTQKKKTKLKAHSHWSGKTVHTFGNASCIVQFSINKNIRLLYNIYCGTYYKM